jgi:hypothetical protein
MTKIYRYSILDASNTPACVETVEKEGSWEVLCTDIVEHDWSPIVFSNNYRKSDNFQSSDIVALDFDHANHDQIIKKASSMQLQYFTAYTRSHLSGKKGNGDFFRMIIPIESRILNVEEYKTHMLNMLEKFPEADEKCKDAARFYFKSPKPGISYVGNPVKIFKSAPIQTNTPKINNINKSEMLETKQKLKEKFEKGISVIPLTSDALSFLLNADSAASEHSFNDSLFKCAKDLFRAGLDTSQVTHLISQAAPNRLDGSDKTAIASAQKSAEKFGKLQEIKTLAEKKNKQGFLDDVIDAKCNEYIKLLNESGDIVHIATFDKNGILSTVSEDNLQSSINSLIKKTSGMKLSARKIKDLGETIKLNLDAMDIEDILPVKFLDQDGFSWSQLDFLPTEGGTPTFDLLTNGWSNQNALYAFIGSLFYPESNKSQYCYIHGQGGEGKSTLSNFLFQIFKNSAVSIKASDGYANRFHGSNLVGKRLAIFPDPNSPSYVISESFKNMTGEEPVSIERKYFDPVTVRLKTKFLITSNVKPNISTNFADQRRLLFVETSKVTVPIYDLNDKLWSERSAIIWKCIQEYKKSCPDPRHPIPCTIPQDLIDNKNMRFISFFDANFEKSSDSEVTIKQIYQSIGGQFSGNREKFFDDFLKFLKNYYQFSELYGTIEGMKLK